MLKYYLCLFFLSTPAFSEETTIKVIPVINRTATEIQSLIQPLLEAPERIIANGSSLILKATPSKQQEIKTLIHQLDTRLINLSITVIQSRSKTAKELNSYINNIKSLSITRPSDFSNRNRGRFAETEGHNKYDITQKVTTLEGQATYIKTGKIIPVENISLFDIAGRYPVISNKTQIIEATTGFIVTPQLTAQQVTLTITPWSNRVNKNGTIDTQEGHSTIRVNLGEWVELANIDKNKTLSKNRTLSHSYSTATKNMRILLKVDKM